MLDVLHGTKSYGLFYTENDVDAVGCVKYVCSG